ncbi:MAG: T9SS type A sorting domain-containing protein [Bacteroidota bacterium]
MNRFILLFCLLPIMANAQLEFGPEIPILPVDEGFIYNLEEAVTADLDGDGDLDAVVLSWSEELVWFENMDGEGSFGLAKFISKTGAESKYVKTWDRDGDGDLDILVTEDRGLYWYENLGGFGIFAERQLLNSRISTSRSLLYTDLNGDGTLDFLHAGSGFFQWFEFADSTDNFELAKAYISSSLGTVADLAVGDVDQDGDLDVALTDVGEGQLLLFINQDSVFAAPQIIMSGVSAIMYSVEIVDLDGDGNLDLLSVIPEEDKVVYFPNADGLATFDRQVVVSEAESNGFFAYSQDLDGDGDMDVLSGNAWIENQNGTFSVPKYLGIPDYQSEVSFPDLDGDGDVDIFFGLSWIENSDGAGDFSPIQWFSSQARGIQKLLARDVDQDGDMDLLGISAIDNVTVWLENINSVFATHSFTFHSKDIAVGDVDGDGDQDVVNLRRDQTIGLFLFHQEGGYYDHMRTLNNEFGQLEQIFLTDLDSDNDLDILYFSTGGVQWLRNEDGLGTFSEGISVPLYTPPSYVYPMDIDADGDVDVIYETDVFDWIYLVENTDGQGTFSSPVLLSQLSVGPIFTPGDFDGDGDLDLLRPEGWHENTTGNGVLGVFHPIDKLAKEGVAFDIDQDGDLDVISESPDNDLAWFENLDGKGTFDEAQIIAGRYADQIAIADLDGDTDLDVIFSAGIFDGYLAWHQNLGIKTGFSGSCFFDENENKIRDPQEFGIFHNKIIVQPSSITAFTDSNGYYEYGLGNGTYTISNLLPDHWELTTDSATYRLNINNSVVRNIDFGLRPTSLIDEVIPTITSGPNRCGFGVPLWLHFENRGTTIASGYITFELDSLTSFVSASPAPDEIINDHLLRWNFTDMLPSFQEAIRLELQMPGVDFIDSSVSFQAKTYIEGESIENASGAYHSTIACAYDPNDKLVDPPGVDDENYTLFKEVLNYTVRFQNTGTDTAFTVRIEDVLDDDLDWSTFRPIAASHDYTPSLDLQDGKVVFLFENILLPDSTTNEGASHGFVQYSIEALDNLPEGTLIENTADIYFDFNPPIRTNTTQNTLVSKILTSTKALPTTVSIEVSPNPFDQYIQIRTADLPKATSYQVGLRDVFGRLLQTKTIQSGQQMRMEGEHLAPGMYFLELRDGANHLLYSKKLLRTGH